MEEKRDTNSRTGLEIAVIGMAGRFPGANNIDEYWNNLKNGVESIYFFSEEEAAEMEIESRVVNHPGFVKSKGGMFEGKGFFDASFFGYSPVEAAVMDPQMRVFHECAWAALEHAGYHPDAVDGLIGLYAGASNNPHWETVSSNSWQGNESGHLTAMLLNDKDFLCTRISYKLNLRGPAIALHSACSTSLVAVHMGCQAILNAECDMALAGGVSIIPFYEKGYISQEGLILSPDGHCRSFDATAKGTIGGNGVGVVVLKLLDDAIAAGDTIHALVKGTAVNNDGNVKSTYTAPSREGQTAVIRVAQQVAEVEAESITYIECHGTGTVVGDPIELDALKQAFAVDKKGFCAIGSVKANIGHLDAAAGVAGFIKVVLALKHRLLPPSLHFENPNPNADFHNSPFYVNTGLKEWQTDKYPLRAGVSSFGIGGTNAHVILEEAPQQIGDHGTAALGEEQQVAEHQLILLSAKTPAALEQMTGNAAAYFKENPGINLADAAYTLQVGREAFQYRKMMICADVNTAVDTLAAKPQDPGATSAAGGKVYTFFSPPGKNEVVFMFPGLGGHYVNMGRELYQNEPLFQKEMDACFDFLKPLVDFDIKEILYPAGHEGDQSGPAPDPLNRFEIAQLVVFIFEYALARLLLNWGIQPSALIGYSFGEYVAAAVAGVISLEDMLTLLAARGRLVNRTPAGTMLSVPLTVEKISPLMAAQNELNIAVDNGASCVIAGPTAAVTAFEKQMKKEHLMCMPLETDRAVHSALMDSILTEFQEEVNKVTLNAPAIPYISNVTGNWLSLAEATDPHYWVTHLRETVRFADGLARLSEKEQTVFVEVGPGNVLGSLVRTQAKQEAGHLIINLFRHPQENINRVDEYFFLRQIGRLWLSGVAIDWQAFHSEKDRKPQRIPLPTYPFERQYFPGEGSPPGNNASLLRKNPDISAWFYNQVWEQSALPVYIHHHDDRKKTGPFHWLLFIDDDNGLETLLIKRLQKDNHHVITVKAGETFTRSGDAQFVINPGNKEDYEHLFTDLLALAKVPQRIIHMWNLPGQGMMASEFTGIDLSLDLGFYSLLYTVQAIGSRGITGDMQIRVVTTGVYDVTGEEEINPLQAVALGAVKIIPLEYPYIGSRCVDIVLPGPGPRQEEYRERLVTQLLGEFNLDFPGSDIVIAYRGKHRWVQKIISRRLEKSPGTADGLRLKEQGVYLVTGGLGGMGFTLAEYLATHWKAKLILVGRSPWPPRSEWQQWLEAPDHRQDKEDPVKAKIRKIIDLEKIGAEIMVVSADVSNEEQMREVVAGAEQRFGPINGILHAAGLADYEGIIQGRTRQMTETILTPKVKGTIVLEHIFKNKKPDFLILFSSAGNILYQIKFGEVGYNAANEFLDAFGRYKNMHEGEAAFTVVINWWDWQGVGMGAEAARKKAAGYREIIDYDAFQKVSISPPEGVEAFKRILASECSLPHFIVSPQDIVPLMERLQKAGKSGWVSEGKKILQKEVEGRDFRSFHQRPEISAAYIEPEDELEQRLADIIRNFLGIQQVGIDDNFFELGLNSLSLLQISNKLFEILNREIHMVTLFTYPTVRTLARYMKQEENTGEETGEHENKDEPGDLLQNTMNLLNVNVKRGSYE